MFKKNKKIALLLSIIFLSLVFLILPTKRSFSKEVFKYYKNDTFNRITLDYNDAHESKREYIYTDMDKINSVLSYLSNVKMRKYNNGPNSYNDGENIEIEHQLRISTLKGNDITILIFNNNFIIVSFSTDNGHYLNYYKILDNSLNSDYIVDILNG